MILKKMLLTNLSLVKKPVKIEKGTYSVEKGIDGLNVNGTLYKVPDEATVVWITKSDKVFLLYDSFIDSAIGQFKRFDFRIHYLDDWKPIKNYQ